MLGGVAGAVGANVLEGVFGKKEKKHGHHSGAGEYGGDSSHGGGGYGSQELAYGSAYVLGKKEKRHRKHGGSRGVGGGSSSSSDSD